MLKTSFCQGWEYSREGGRFEPVTVPHDAMRDERRGPDAPAGSASGFYYGTSFRYRKSFELTVDEVSSTLLLEFEAVYRNARIRVNGCDVTTPPYGFVPFFADITGLVHEGRNTVEVEGGNEGQPDCRWYSGAGIIRPVWLWRGGQVCIAPEGVRITTTSYNPPAVRIDVGHSGGIPAVSIYEGDELIAGASGDALELTLQNAALWSPEQPALYRCVVELRNENTGQVLDTAQTVFGIRLLEWNPNGLLLNGKRTYLRGGCIHCDNGILGAASYPNVERRRIDLLKRAGFNAVRIAHNPAPEALLDACDELGMLVLDETWDTWFTAKSAHDYSHDFLDWLDFDLDRLASRDYNHPSVIMYSIGNEIADPITQPGLALERSMVELMHSLDPTRPVTCGFNLTMMVMERAGRGWYVEETGVGDLATDNGAPRGSLLFNLTAQAMGSGMTLIANAPGADKLVSPALDALDIAGYNYASARYAIDARKHPDRIVLGTETFPHELYRNWEKVERIDNLIGDFMWAAWDYLGEAGAGAWAYTPEEAGFSKPWPWLIAGSGALDILGQPGAPAALAQAVWRTARKPSIQVRPVNIMNRRTYKATWRGSDAVPSWSWSGCSGTKTQVEVYDGSAHAVRLELNGGTIDQKPVRKCVAEFSLEYRAGTLTAVSLDANGNELARSSLSSATAPFHLALRNEFKTVRAGEVALVMVEITGSNGEVESNADEKLTAQADDGILLAFGSALPAPTDRFCEGRYPSYRGRALAAIYRSEPGTARLTVRGETLAPTSIEVEFCA